MGLPQTKIDKVDLFKELKEVYTAGRRAKEVTIDMGNYIYVDGRGEPGGEAFQRTIEELYSVAYTLKFALKLANILDFKVSKLECLWYSDPSTPMDKWRWRVLIRVPDSIKKREVERVKKRLLKERDIDVSEVEWTAWREGRAIQVMHVGPYDSINNTYNALFAAAGEMGLMTSGPPHEIYLSDPNRSRSESLKTIVRVPVKKSKV